MASCKAPGLAMAVGSVTPAPCCGCTVRTIDISMMPSRHISRCSFLASLCSVSRSNSSTLSPFLRPSSTSISASSALASFISSPRLATRASADSMFSRLLWVWAMREDALAETAEFAAVLCRACFPPAVLGVGVGVADPRILRRYLNLIQILKSENQMHRSLI